MLRGLGRCPRAWRLAASGTSVSAGSSDASPVAPASIAVRSRNSRRRMCSSGCSSASRPPSTARKVAIAAPPRAGSRDPRRLRPVKAAVIYENGGPDVLRYEDVPDPECPDGCVLIDAEAISIEGGDLLARAGGDLPRVPHVVGYLSAGTIAEVGAGVEDRAVGDRVVALNAFGSHAAKRAVPAMVTWPIPDGLDAAAAACIPVAFGTAYECLFTAGNLEAGQTVLVHAGAGGVGMAAIQLAKQA